VSGAIAHAGQQDVTELQYRPYHIFEFAAA